MLKNIVYIDKPFPKKHPTRTDFNRRCVKLMIKTNLCKYKGFRFVFLNYVITGTYFKTLLLIVFQQQVKTVKLMKLVKVQIT